MSLAPLPGCRTYPDAVARRSPPQNPLATSGYRLATLRVDCPGMSKLQPALRTLTRSFSHHRALLRRDGPVCLERTLPSDLHGTARLFPIPVAGYTLATSILRMLMTLESRATTFLTFLVWAGMALAATGEEQILRTEANVMVELTFRASRSYADPFNEVTLDVIVH